MKLFYKSITMLLFAAGSVFVLSACGGEESVDMTLNNENKKAINLADKDQPTVLFHFTGVN